MRVLVTGHHGYIGSLLMPLLAERGIDACGLDSDLFAACTFGTRVDERWPSMHKDLRDVTVGELEGFDVVMHLAALSNDPLGDLNPNLTYDINLDGSLRLARLAKQAGVSRFLFSSSCSNYGASGDGLLDERAELSPLTPYAVSKVKLEEELTRLADENFSPVFLRNATAYGISPRLRVDLVLNNLTAWAVTTGKIVLQSDGTPWRPIVHVEDICRAFLLLADAPREKVHAQAFNVGASSENYRIRELAEIVGETIPGCEVTFAKDAGPDARNYRVSSDKLTETFPDFRLKWNARTGAREIYEAYLAAGLTKAEFDGPRYKRLAHIRQLLDAGTLSNDLRWTSAAQPVTA
ncbi:MAG: SDR family oxidoreductase [Thermoanaerobaculia bacterium]